MTRYLRELLAASEPAFSQAIREFELATGNKGLDISLSTEIERSAQNALKQLGLDMADSTMPEIYHALQALTGRHDEFISVVTGRPNLSSPSEVAMVLGELFYKVGINREVWVIKTSVMRRLLRQLPPRAIMKRLGYRSIDSMIKREDVLELMLGARMMESTGWMARLTKNYKRLKPSDFETRPVQFVALESQRWQTAFDNFRSQKQLTVAHVKELGALGILPISVQQQRSGMTLFTYLQAIHYFNEIKSYSSYFKLKQVEAGFGELVSRTLSSDPKEAAQVLGRPIHWKSIRRHVSKMNKLADSFQSHLTDDDLTWTRAEDLLFRLEPALHFWQGLEGVGLATPDRPLSFNLMDNVVCLVNGRAYEDRLSGHMQAAVGNDLLSQYLASSQLEDNIIRQLEPAGSEEAIATFFEEEF